MQEEGRRIRIALGGLGVQETVVKALKGAKSVGGGGGLYACEEILQG